MIHIFFIFFIFYKTLMNLHILISIILYYILNKCKIIIYYIYVFLND